MKKVLPYLGVSLSALALALSAPVKAQDAAMFTDVPADHWAYKAVADLQAQKILEGYPNGYFVGKRVLTRYEFAIALSRALSKVQATQGTKGDKGDKGDQGDKGDKGDQGVPGMTPDEVLALRRLTDDFKAELTALGVNIRDINSKLDSLTKDVADLRDQVSHLPKVGINAFIGVRTDRSRFNFIDYGGAFRNASTSHFSAADVVHDVHIPISANLPGGLKLLVEPVASNYLSYRGNTLSAFSAANNAINTGNGASNLAEVGTLYKAQIDIPIGGPESNYKLTVGRYGYQITPGTYYRPDLDPYFDVPSYDDGNYIQDGAKLEAKFGSARTTLFAASFATPTLTGTGTGAASAFNKPLIGGGYNNIFGKPFNIDASGQTIQANQTAGAHVALPLFRFGELGLTLATFSTNSLSSVGVNTPFNNVVLYGANFKLNAIGRFVISGEGAKTVTGVGLDNSGSAASELNGNEDNYYYNGSVGYNSGPITAQVGYQRVDPRYGAPGYWNKIGNWYNPTNLAGPYLRLGYRISDGLNITFGGDYMTAVHNAVGLNIGDEIYRFTGGAHYVINKRFSIGADYEGVIYNLSAATTGIGVRSQPIEQYVTLGAGLNLASNTVLKVGYQIINFQNVGSGFGGGTGIAGIATGGNASNATVFTTQLAVHF